MLSSLVSYIKEHAVAIIRTKNIVGCPPTQHSDSFSMLSKLVAEVKLLSDLAVSFAYYILLLLE